MTSHDVERLKFDFPDGWQVSKYDDWAFYRHRFTSAPEWSVKAVDLIAVSPQNVCWLIEVKDYSHPAASRARIKDLPHTVAAKAKDTLAGLVVASTAADEGTEREIARAAVRCSRLRVVLHYEQPADRLYPITAADLLPKLKRAARPIDFHPLVMTNRSSAPWQVTRMSMNPS